MFSQRLRGFANFDSGPTFSPFITRFDVECPVTALTRWDEKAGLHGMRYAPRIDVLYAQEKETGDEED